MGVDGLKLAWGDANKTGGSSRKTPERALVSQQENSKFSGALLLRKSEAKSQNCATCS